MQNNKIENCVNDFDNISLSFDTCYSDFDNMWKGPVHDSFYSRLNDVNNDISFLEEHMKVYENVEKILKKIEEIDEAIEENQIRLNGLSEEEDGAYYQKNSGICLETQFYPNSCNEKDFPSPILEAGKRFLSKTIYGFEVEQRV